MWRALCKVCGANLSRSNYLQRTQLHKLSIVVAITAGPRGVGNNSLVTNLTPFSFSGGGGGEGERKEEKKLQRSVVLKFPSLFALPIVATEINTYLASDNLANCQTLKRGVQGLQPVYGWRVCACVCLWWR